VSAFAVFLFYICFSTLEGKNSFVVARRLLVAKEQTAREWKRGTVKRQLFFTTALKNRDKDKSE